MSTQLGRWQVAALRGLMAAERDMDAADMLVTEMMERLRAGERLSEADDLSRRDAERTRTVGALGAVLNAAESPAVRRALDRAVGSLWKRGLVECVGGRVRVSDWGAGALAAREGAR